MKTAYMTIVALAAFGGSAMAAPAATPLDGMFNGSYACPSFQGQTNVLLNFTVSGNRVKLIEVIYHNANSKYNFGSSVIEYYGAYAPATRKFQVGTLQTIGDEPDKWTYSRNLSGSVTADGSVVTVLKDPSGGCSDTTARRVTTTSVIKN